MFGLPVGEGWNAADDKNEPLAELSQVHDRMLYERRVVGLAQLGRRTVPEHEQSGTVAPARMAR